MLFENNGNLTACCVCHKIKNNDGLYVSIEALDVKDFLLFKDKNKAMQISHSYCETCIIEERKKMKKAIEERKKSKR